MAQLSDKFEEYLAGLSDDEWKALEGRVRAPASAAGNSAGQTLSGANAKAGLDEARRRGYVKDEGKR